MMYALGALDKFGDMPVCMFGPKSLVRIRSQLAAEGYVRSTVNHMLSRLKKFFRWASENELAPPDLYHKLMCVRGLVKGEVNCAESEPVRPANTESVFGVLPYVSEAVAAMIQVQYWCGMRPMEVCLMRTCDIDRSEAVWLYRPHRHKNEWRGLSSVKAIPMKAQALLLPFLLRPGYLFSPQRKREHYTTEVYRRAVQYGFRKVHKSGGNLEPFNPNQLRHAIATLVSQQLGQHAAQVWIGHENMNTTAIYTERQTKELVAIAQQLEARWNASA
jgi:integrase